MNRRVLFWGYWFPVIVYCVFIFVQSAFPTPEEISSFAISDKLLHLMGYALLGVLFYRSFSKTLPRWGAVRVILFSVLCTTLYGATDEFHQSFVASRTADGMDLAADFAGATIGSACFFLLLLFWGKVASRISD